VMVQTPPVAFPPPAKWPTPTSAVPIEAKAAPVEAKAAPAAAKPTALESPRVESPIPTRVPVRTRPAWQSPRYLGLAAATVLLLAGIGIYYAASTPARKEARDSARVAAVEQQKAQVDQLRTGVVAAAERATKAEAGALAVAVLSRAQAAQAEGERLATAGDFKAATQAYQEAGERFAEAERTAQTKREQRTAADAARAQMAAAKQRASSAAPDYARALEGERQAGSLYAQTSFPEATAGFRAAADLFAKALPPEPSKPASVAPAPSAPAAPSAAATPTPSATPSTPTPSTAPATPSAPAAGAPNPRAEIRSVLDTYVRAIETKNLASLQQVRPGLTADEINRMRVANEIKKSHKVDLKVDEITVNGDQARATGRREDDINLKEGQRIRQDSKFIYTLKHGSRGWFIQEAREEAVQAPRGTAADSTSRGGRKP
jgi:hypothetical protein